MKGCMDLDEWTVNVGRKQTEVTDGSIFRSDPCGCLSCCWFLILDLLVRVRVRVQIWSDAQGGSETSDAWKRFRFGLIRWITYFFSLLHIPSR